MEEQLTSHIPTEQPTVESNGIYSPKISNSKKIDSLTDENYELILNQLKEDTSPDRIDINPELATFLDDDSVSYEDNNGNRVGVRFSSLSAIESVDKENEYIAILNDESSTMAEKIEANKKITELGFEKKGTSEALKTFNSEIRANYDVVAINPELDNDGKIQFDVYNRQLAKDAVLRNKITGREQSYAELMVMGGFTVDGNNIAESGSELSRIEKNRNISQQEYFGIKNNIELVESNYRKDYEHINTEVDKVSSLMTKLVAEGKTTPDEANAILTGFAKRHTEKHGSPKARRIASSETTRKFELALSDHTSGYDVPKLMEDFKTLNARGVKVSLTSDMEDKIVEYYSDEYGSLKGGVNGNAKDKAKLAEINGFLKAFSTAGYKTENGVKKSLTRQLNDLSVRTAASIDMSKLTPQQEESINDSISIFDSIGDSLTNFTLGFGDAIYDLSKSAGVSKDILKDRDNKRMSNRETFVADVEDFSLKNKQDPTDVLKYVGIINNPDDEISRIEKILSKAKIEEFDFNFEDDGAGDLGAITQYALSKLDKDSKEYKDIKSSVKPLYYAEAFIKDKYKESASAVQATIGRALDYGKNELGYAWDVSKILISTDLSKVKSKELAKAKEAYEKNDYTAKYQAPKTLIDKFSKKDEVVIGDTGFIEQMAVNASMLASLVAWTDDSHKYFQDIQERNQLKGYSLSALAGDIVGGGAYFKASTKIATSGSKLLGLGTPSMTTVVMTDTFLNATTGSFTDDAKAKTTPYLDIDRESVWDATRLKEADPVNVMIGSSVSTIIGTSMKYGSKLWKGAGTKSAEDASTILEDALTESIKNTAGFNNAWKDSFVAGAKELGVDSVSIDGYKAKLNNAHSSVKTKEPLTSEAQANTKDFREQELVTNEQFELLNMKATIDAIKATFLDIDSLSREEKTAMAMLELGYNAKITEYKARTGESPFKNKEASTTKTDSDAEVFDIKKDKVFQDLEEEFIVEKQAGKNKTDEEVDTDISEGINDSRIDTTTTPKINKTLIEETGKKTTLEKFKDVLKPVIEKINKLELDYFNNSSVFEMGELIEAGGYQKIYIKDVSSKPDAKAKLEEVYTNEGNTYSIKLDGTNKTFFGKESSLAKVEVDGNGRHYIRRYVNQSIDGGSKFSDIASAKIASAVNKTADMSYLAISSDSRVLRYMKDHGFISESGGLNSRAYASDTNSGHWAKNDVLYGGYINGTSKKMNTYNIIKKSLIYDNENLSDGKASKQANDIIYEAGGVTSKRDKVDIEANRPNREDEPLIAELEAVNEIPITRAKREFNENINDKYDDFTDESKAHIYNENIYSHFKELGYDLKITKQGKVTKFKDPSTGDKLEYGSDNKPMDGIDLIMHITGSDYKDAYKYYYKEIKGREFDSGKFYKDESRATSISNKIPPKNQFFARDISKDDKGGMFRSINSYFSKRKFPEYVDGLNFREMFNDFINNTENANMGEYKGQFEIRYKNKDGEILFNRKDSGKNKSYKKVGGFEDIPVFKNYKESEAPDIVVYAESINDGFAFIQKLKSEGKDITLDTKIKIVDMAGLPPRPDDGGKIIQYQQAGADAKKKYFATDNHSKETKQHRINKEMFAEAMNDVDEGGIFGAKVEKHTPDKKYKDFNEEITAKYNENKNLTILESIEKNVKESTDTETEKRSRDFVAKSLATFGNLVDAFTHSTGNKALGTTSKDINYNPYTAKIALNNKYNQTFRDVAHEVLHSIQESTILKRGDKTKADGKIDNPEIEAMFEAFSSNSLVQAKLDELAPLTHQLLQERIGSYGNTDAGKRNATREVLVEMMIDDKIAKEMGSVKMKDVDGVFTLEKIEAGNLLSVNPESILGKLLSSLSDAFKKIKEGISNKEFNIYDDSIYATIYKKIDAELKTDTDFTRSNGKRGKDNTLYASNKNTRRRLDKALDEAIINGFNSVPNALRNSKVSGAKELAKYAIPLKDKSLEWARKLDYQIASGVVSETLSAGWRYLNSTKDMNEHITNLASIVDNINKDAGLTKESFIRTTQEAYEKIKQEHHRSMKALMNYDLKSLSFEDIDSVLGFIKNNDRDGMNSLIKTASVRMKSLEDILSNSKSEGALNGFKRDIELLRAFMVNKSYTTSTPNNAVEIASKYFPELKEKDSFKKVIQVIDDDLTLGMFAETVNVGGNVVKSPLFNKLVANLANGDIDSIGHIFKVHKQALTDRDGTSANVTDIGRKGDIVDPDLSNMEMTAMPKRDFEALSSKEKEELKNFEIFSEDKNWVFIASPNSNIAKQEGFLTGSSNDYHLDAKINISDIEIKELNGIKDDTELNTYITENYSPSANHNIYVKRNTKGNITGLYKAVPYQRIADKESNIIHLMSEEVYQKNVMIKRNYAYESFLKQNRIVSPEKMTDIEEATLLKRIKDSTTKDYTENSLPMDLIFINEKSFQSDTVEAGRLFTSVEFRNKYTKIDRSRDTLPPEFDNETYIRSDMYNELVDMKLDLGMKWLSDEKHTKLRRLINKLRDAVKTQKTAVTLANPDTQINNIVANGVKLVQLMGADVVQAKVLDTTKNLIDYQKLILEHRDAYLSKDDTLFKELDIKLKAHPMKFYDDRGMFSTLIDGVETEGAKQKFGVYDTVAGLYKKHKGKVGIGESKYEKFGRKVAGEIFFASGSKTLQFGGNVMRFGDFVPRVILHKYLYDQEIKNGSKEADALKYADKHALEQFVNAKDRHNRIVSSLDVFGIASFARFGASFARSQVSAGKMNPTMTGLLAGLIWYYNSDNENASFKARSISPISTALDKPSNIFSSGANIPDIFEATYNAIDIK